jgi:hypothetical protein
MIHFLICVALVVGIWIMLTLFVQHQRDRRDLRRALAPPPPPRYVATNPPTTRELLWVILTPLAISVPALLAIILAR